jgi:hypothetical protein
MRSNGGVKPIGLAVSTVLAVAGAVGVLWLAYLGVRWIDPAVEWSAWWFVGAGVVTFLGCILTLAEEDLLGPAQQPTMRVADECACGNDHATVRKVYVDRRSNNVVGSRPRLIFLLALPIVAIGAIVSTGYVWILTGDPFDSSNIRLGVLTLGFILAVNRYRKSGPGLLATCVDCAKARRYDACSYSACTVYTPFNEWRSGVSMCFVCMRSYCESHLQRRKFDTGLHPLGRDHFLACDRCFRRIRWSVSYRFRLLRDFVQYSLKASES